MNVYQELELAHEKIRQLEIEQKKRARGEFKIAFGITPQQDRILACMMRLRVATYQDMFDELQDEVNGEPKSKNPRGLVRVHSWGLRRVLEAHDVKVNLVWGVGYCITTEDKAKVNAIVDAAMQIKGALKNGG